MSRWLLAGLALLAACSSGGLTPVERLGPSLRAALLADAPTAPAPVPTRADLDQVRSALIGVTFDGGQRAFIRPRADNGGYVTYQDPARRGVVLLGAGVAGTDGFAQDLAAVRHQIDDPVARQTPPAAWPGEVWRSYQFRVRDGAPFVISLRCTFANAGPARIEIVERSYDTQRIDETCRNAAREVANSYWVDPVTGYVWKSRQWVGPNLPAMTIEVIRPYAPG